MQQTKKFSKKLVTLLMALVFCFSFSVTAFADEIEEDVSLETYEVLETIETSDSSEVLETSEIITEETITIEPGEDIDVNSAIRKIWRNPSYTVNVGTTTYTPQFTIPDRYFAYEISATASNGNAISEMYQVFFRTADGSQIAGISKNADGSVGKVDWITVNTAETYQFMIKNNTSQQIRVTLKYYSWK